MKKIVYAIDGILLIGSLFALTLLIGYVNPMVISPIDNFETAESVLFSIEKAEKIFIDSDIDFSNPKEYSVKDGLEINLEPGEYYWKASNSVGFETDIRKLTILSKIDLKLIKTSEGYDITNAGNIKLNVDVYNQSEYIKSFKLIPGEVKQTEGDKFVGGWDEE